MGTKSQFNDFIEHKVNIEKAATLLKEEWYKLSKAEQDTFLNNSPFNGGTEENTDIKDHTGFFAFMNYFMKTFSTENTGQTMRNISLTSGNSNNYVDRASRTFTIA